MSNPRPTPHVEKPSTTTNKLHRSYSEPTIKSTLDEETPEEEAVLASGNLLRQKTLRELDLIDGMQSTADVLDKILDMIQELMIRMRQVEALTDNPQETKRNGGCGMNCANNSFTL